VDNDIIAVMATLLWLALILGVAPLGVALIVLPSPRVVRPSFATLSSSAMLCALAFNLTFFWQELWLVLAKAMTPGLHPILYHNDHDWTGTAPQVELLQGAGALATFVSGLAFLALLALWRSIPDGARLLVAWLAFEGLFQSLSQVAIGTLIPGNDVGRAFAYLGMDGVASAITLGIAAIGIAATGLLLARYWPTTAERQGERPDRTMALTLAIPAAAAIFLLIPFRLPRALAEVVLVPVVVNIIGIGWTSLGLVWARSSGSTARPILLWSTVALLVLLAIFQLVLARGVAL